MERMKVELDLVHDPSTRYGSATQHSQKENKTEQNKLEFVITHVRYTTNFH